MHDFSIKIKSYKCFKNESGFDAIRRVNLIIGKNNAGKSSLLDIIEQVANIEYQFDQSTWREGKSPQIIFSSPIPKSVINSVFSANTSGGYINGSHRLYGTRLIDKKIVWSKAGKGHDQVQLIECDDAEINPPLAKCGDYAQRLPANIPIPLEGKTFRRVLAERDIIPEVDNTKIVIKPNGNGITNAIQCFINRSNPPSKVVETDLLNALNVIFSHDAKFTDIVCQPHESNLWEIYLEEQQKGRIALSKSGSGLKTVITVLACLFLVPKLENKPLTDYIFGFEELENNIHPALLRRLNDYIYKASIESNFIYFLTTHSNVLIDQFSKQDDAQILHVTQKNEISQCVTTKTYIDNNGILDDLDVRASDLLQSNGIIWVEGPSDRAYINRWIQLWSNGELREGTHYQILFYGGRLLSHLSASQNEIVNGGLSILNANRNAAIIIDSDKKSQQARINDTKRRIQKEFEELGATCWITRGKEIENYIPSDVVDLFWGLKNSPPVGQYDSFFDHIDSLSQGEGSKYFSRKSLLAEKLLVHMNINNMREALDLDEKIQGLCACIRDWNS